MSTTPFPADSIANIEAIDQSPLLVGTPEELAGPPELATAPVTQAERVSSIDALRGISLMGILIMNITDFAYGYQNYMFPLSTVKPVFNGPHWKANTTLWFLRWILAEGKMRGLFSILFGAGVILLTSRAESRGAGVRTADIFTRRNMWLLLFGMLHCFFIWNGDILYFYAMAALVFLFPFRHLKVKTLFWVAGIVLLLNTILVNGGQTMQVVSVIKSAAPAHAAEAAHKPLTDEQKSALEAEKKADDQWRNSTKTRDKDIAAHHGYAKAFVADAPNGIQGELFGGFPLFAGDWFGMMILGMALYRNGFLSLKSSTKTYALTAFIGLGIAWSVTAVSTYHAWKSGFDHLKTMLWIQLPYDIGRIAGALGIAGLVLLCLRLGVFKFLLARCAAVGQMALTNYLLTSITMRFIYIWSPLHWYGYVEYYKIYYAVAGMWLFNLTFSTIWLRFFRFGPVEWCWRSLTYWKRQPMLLRPKSVPALPTPETAAA